ncbi:rhomboid-like protein [Kitasatospora brasiliensis]|uniref:rhomboid-like protein n=1 Tax=Kitasatospora brasiliensis TaxID=3058040 RepID=UPI00292F2A95|nr:rhomboid-like protein [Kitasatospora sp. K002]
MLGHPATTPANPVRRPVRRLVRNPAAWYAAALALMWPVQELLSPDRLERLRQWASTDLDNLRPWPSGHPVEALVASAFVPQDSAPVWGVFALSAFTAVSVLGARRAVAVLAGVHAGVTVATQVAVRWRIDHGSLPAEAAHELDTGPSYLVVAAMAVAIGCGRPLWWRALWLVLLAVAAPGLLDGIEEGAVSAIGHLLSFVAGLAVVCALRWRAPSPVASTLTPRS